MRNLVKLTTRWLLFDELDDELFKCHRALRQLAMKRPEFAPARDAVLDVLLEDVFNRPNSVKLPLLLTVARDPQNPKASEAKDVLELFLEQQRRRLSGRAGAGSIGGLDRRHGTCRVGDAGHRRHEKYLGERGGGAVEVGGDHG